MNPSRISTPIATKIDEWHFWAMVNGRKHVIFEIEMRRPRDIEAKFDGGFKFSFWGILSRKMPGEDIAAILGKAAQTYKPPIIAPTLDILRTRLIAWIEAISSKDWVKVIAVNVKPQGDYNGLRFTYGVGWQSKCGKFFRLPGDNAYAYDEPRFCEDWEEQFGTIHPYNENLERGLEQIAGRVDDLAAALLKLTRNPQQLTASLAKLLPPAKP